ncbi:MAG TPA: cupin domain-containing protein [Blastocatellia bacterium]|nr:cupin domain-containing protein [Blastocatellia bacterium]HMX24388.1 cupin domain-containing protein [Blastocatellia bacterium]HMY72114.1 cupin domain-containing protein [Blastocatellia bacterium]HMZ16986.1 cupin domain-containing protein [Blastocatellia bacterium]HNG29947.1 cupin domain-containing protein [Blastocatellia bacterium]
MLTARDLTVAAIAVAATLTFVKFTPSLTAQTKAPAQTPATITSTVFDWNKMESRPTKVGAVRQVVQAPTPTLDELECHITTLNPGQTPHEPHKHVDEELILVKEGTVESLVNGERRRATAGSVIFQSSNQLHAIRNIGDTPATYFVVKWNSPGMMRPLSDWKPPQKK